MGRKPKAKTTRVKTVKQEPEELTEMKRMFINDVERRVEAELQKLKKNFEDSVENATYSYNLICSKLGDKILNTPYYDFPESPPDVSSPSPTSKTRRRSKSCTPGFAVPKAPAGRPLARSESEACIPNQLVTPANQGLISLSSRMITPKITEDAPLTVLRRPRQGELAISMSGSPLLVSQTVHENLVNINIPLEDGNVLSILPKRGLRRADLPANLSDITKQQLEAIFHNLNVILRD